MAKRRQNVRDIVFFPDRLQDQLDRVTEYPLTIVSAPSGFGKTTAVREYLKTNLPHSGRQFWYTFLGESPTRAWAGICLQISRLDSERGARLADLGYPREDTLVEILSLIQSLCCESETVFVFDNYQLIQSDPFDEFIHAVSLHANPHLHVIVITQQLELLHCRTVSHSQILMVDTSHLLFREEDIDRYCCLSSLRLRKKDIHNLYECTGGWIAALRLYLLHYRETGSIEGKIGLGGLLEIAVWHQCSEEEQDLLLLLSIFEQFTRSQVLMMLEREELPLYAEKLLYFNAFIHYEPDQQIFSCAGILRNYLRNRLEKGRSARFQQAAFGKAGRAHTALGQYYEAAQCFYRAGDFDSLLSLPLNRENLVDWTGLGHDAFILNINKECPKKILCRYPRVLLAFAFEMFLIGKYDAFSSYCQIVDEIIETADEIDEEERRYLMGEMALLTSFSAFNDIEKMSEGHREAYRLLEGATSAFVFRDSWTFGVPSIVCLFWRVSGALRVEATRLKECLPYYIKLTNGHGTGSACVMEAEILLLAGDDKGAERLCYKGRYLAAEAKQESICFVAELLLARIALLRADREGYREMLQSMNHRAVNGLERSTRYMMDLANAFLNVNLGFAGEAVPWLMQKAMEERCIYEAAVPFSQLVYARLLLLGQQYDAFLGLSEPLIQQAEAMNALLPKVYYLIGLAIAWSALLQEEPAGKALEKALSIALPDRIYLPFAEHGEALRPLLEAAKDSNPDVDGIRRILALCDRQQVGVKKISAAIHPPLTPREREIAVLAKDGMTTKEIAETLHISSETVKMAFKRIFLKLNIQSRVQLNDLDI